MLENVLHIGLDLGGDTLKISFAYRDDEEVHYGKFVGENDFLQVAIPAVAYYDVVDGNWYYGDEIDKKSPEEYITVVKIKSLIAMLSQPAHPTEADIKIKRGATAEERQRLLQKEWKARLAVWESNKNFYEKETKFPKFYFPVKREILHNFAKMVELDMTFSASNATPKAVCREFFRYVYALVKRRKLELEQKLGHTFTSLSIALVHPAKVGEEYLAELGDLVRQAFGRTPAKVLSTNKALALYAKHRKAVREGEQFLVFDMGEESLSVVQATVANGQVTIDGVEGHSRPCAIGGNDIDEAIVHFLEKRINDRETLGTPPAGEEGHIYEGSAYGKQYMLVKDVKKVKVVFSEFVGEDNLFANGVPVTVRREVLVQCKLTQKDIKRSVGVQNNTGIAQKIAAYILEEVRRPINRAVKKIFLAGGAIETYSLLDYIKECLKSEGVAVTVCTFDDDLKEGDDFAILSHEDSVFASALGGALVSLFDIDVKTVFSLSYAAWVNGVFGSAAKHLEIFANRGETIEASGTVRFSQNFAVVGRGVSGEELFSVLWTKEDMMAEHSKRSATRYTFSPDGRLEIGEPNSDKRRMVEKETGPGLKRVSGGADGKIRLWFRGQYVALSKGVQLWIKEGISLDKHGNATPVVRNCKEKNMGYGLVFFLGNNPEGQPVSQQTVPLEQIEPRFMGLSDFSTSIS